MGWSFTRGASRADVVKELTGEWQNEGITARCLTYTLKGNVLWSVRELTYSDGRTLRVIFCDLLARQRGYGWGYKGMEESMGPCYFTCPLAYFEMVPAQHREWRAKVQEYHEATRRRLAVKLVIGQTVKLEGSNIPSVIVTGLPKGRGALLGMYNGKTYRVSRRFLAVDPDNGGTNGQERD
jgi:hypothetical protein